MQIYPFKALRPTPERVAEVASVPYDVVMGNEARELSEGKPWSFLRVVRPEVNFEEGHDMYAPEVYVKSREVLRMFEQEGVLVREDSESIYVYRVQMGEHVQHGIVACCDTGDVDRQLIKRHEKTREDKLRDRVKLIDTLSAHSGPVYLTYRDQPAIDALVAACEQQPPLFDIVDEAEIRHTIWKAEDAQTIVAAFEDVPASYVADGHHRLAAAGEVARMRRERDSAIDANEVVGSDLLLTVLFPSGQLQILPYNRCVVDLNGLSSSELLERCADEFEAVTESDESQPGRGNIKMYLDGKWYLLRTKDQGHSDPVAKLDVSILQDRLLGPVLDIDDPRTNERIFFVGGVRGSAELVKTVDSGAAAVAFLMCPVTVEQMMDIADADMIMSPKSTWFEPKLRSGLLTHTF